MRFPCEDTGKRQAVPLLADILLAALAAVVSAVLVGVWQSAPATEARPSLEPARVVGEAARSHGWLRRLLMARIDRSTATGLLLTIVLVVALVGGVLLGVLAYLIRTVGAVQRVDNSVAAWGFRHRTSVSSDGLRLITDLGTARVVLVLAAAVFMVDLIRTRSRWTAPFLVTVLAGNEIVTLTVKELAGRVRPALVPLAAHLGPSFPSGHSSTSASFYAAAALVLGRFARRWVRQLLAGGAIGSAVAVAASRVLLDLHWLSDVIGGLALGWGWFALCTAIFGGRLLRPTAAVDTARATAKTTALKHP